MQGAHILDILWNYLLFFKINQSINQSIYRTAHPPLKRLYIALPHCKCYFADNSFNEKISGILSLYFTSLWSTNLVQLPSILKIRIAIVSLSIFLLEWSKHFNFTMCNVHSLHFILWFAEKGIWFSGIERLTKTSI